MRLTYFYRSLKCGISIKKVFNTVADEISKTHNIKQYYVPHHRADVKSVLRNIFYVFKHRDKNGINHITGDVQYCMVALIGCKSVLTIHDLSHLDRARNTVDRMLLKLVWYKFPLLIADKIVCISEHTRNELIKITKRKDIEVIYNAIDPSFTIKLKEFNEEKPVILQIGTTWNKNLLNIITATTSIKCHFVIIGLVDDLLLNLLKENNMSYAIKTNLTDKELIQEYYECDIVSFCSLYEGFGMPIIEGNAIGRCVITSAIPPMTEIASNAACLVNPNDISSIKNGLKKIISESNYRDSLINNGIANIDRFKVDTISKSYLNLYTKI
ncbi:glycosyltransferase [Gammaproteobacteria bacterium]|nr:glycosyltransferase [Gammaproteobacteria bacterium]